MKKRFEALVKNGADSVIILSRDYKPIYISRSITNILGYTSDEIMILDLMTLIHPDDRLMIQEKAEKVMKG